MLPRFYSTSGIWRVDKATPAIAAAAAIAGATGMGLAPNRGGLQKVPVAVEAQWTPSGTACQVHS